jgi:hypothetical protein
MANSSFAFESESLAKVGLETLLGCTGDCHGIALAKTTIDRYKADLVCAGIGPVKVPGAMNQQL